MVEIMVNDDTFRQAISRHLNEVLYVEKEDKSHFISKLVAVRGNLLIWVTKGGAVRTNDISEIAFAYPLPIYKKQQ